MKTSASNWNMVLSMIMNKADVYFVLFARNPGVVQAYVSCSGMYLYCSESSLVSWSSTLKEVHMQSVRMWDNNLRRASSRLK